MKFQVSAQIAGLALAATVYFALSSTVTLEWIDEGQLVYQSWLVSLGAVPHREFQHVYGPSTYLVNGALFRVFGPDLLVIRLSLVVLKSVVSVLVYLIASRVASPIFALLAFISTVIVWGGPWWVFNTPYASHYALALVLSGVWIFLRREGAVAALLAGLCCGVAATFKQTTGLFGFFALVLCLVWDATSSSSTVAGTSRAGQVLRLLAVIGSVAVTAGYFASGNTVWNVIALAGPFALGIAWVAVREVQRGARAGTANVASMMAAGLGMAAPLMVCITAYGAMGLLDNLVASTVSGLPQLIKWFFPVSLPDARSSLIGLSVFAMIAGVYLLARRGVMGLIVLGVGVAASAVAALNVVRSPGILDYLKQDVWIGDVFRLVFLIPFIAIVVAWAALIAGEGSHPSGGDARSAARARVLLTFTAASGLLSLYPAADFWHLVMVWPVLAPLLGWQLERVIRHPDGHVLPLAVFVLGGVLMVCGAPFVHALAVARLSRPAEATPLAHASYVTDGSEKVRDVAALLRYLDAQPANRPLLSFGEGQMLDFLAGRRSVLEREGFAFYLVGTGFIAADDARALVPQTHAIARIEAAQPIIVTVDDAPFTNRMRDVFAELAGYIDTHYQTASTFGPYRVLLHVSQR